MISAQVSCYAARIDPALPTNTICRISSWIVESGSQSQVEVLVLSYQNLDAMLIESPGIC